MYTPREAFAIRRCENNFQQILVCLACLAIEASTNKPLDQRVNAFKLLRVGDKVINPDLGPRDISTYYSDANPLDSQEKQAGLEFKNAVLNYPEGTVVVWISPPGGKLNYQEGRIVVGVNKADHMEVYGICTKFTSQECLQIGRSLAEPHEDVLQDPEQLRGTAFILDKLSEDPWDFLKSKIPLEEVWDSIATGEAQRSSIKAWEDARRIVTLLWPFLRNLRGWAAQIVMGAFLERLMMGHGHAIAAGACGILNSQILGEPSGSVIDSGKFVKNCGQCGRSIGRIISKGYRCDCGGVYSGC